MYIFIKKGTLYKNTRLQVQSRHFETPIYLGLLGLFEHKKLSPPP